MLYIFSLINKNYKLFKTYSYSPSPSTSYTMGPISFNTRRCIANIARLLTNLLLRIAFVSTSYQWTSPPNPNVMPLHQIEQKLCRQQQVIKTLSQTSMSRNRMPLLSTLQRFFRIPKVHSTSFRTLSRLVEKNPFLDATDSPLKGQIRVGQR